MLHITKDAKVVLGELNGIDDEMLINAFAQNSNDSRHMLIGGQSAKHIKSNGIYESLDGGITWSRIFGLPSMGTVFEIAFSPITDEAFISGYTGGVIVYDYDAFHKYQSRAKSR
jgi:hypothetical protein